MADEPTLTPDPAPAPEPVVKDPPVLLGGTDPAPDPADPPEPDWRDRIAKVAGDDPKYRTWLNRFASEENFHKAVPKIWREFGSAKSLAQSGPPEDATPEEIAAFRKVAGIPEKADGYGIAYPQDLKPSEADIAALTAFQEHMHSRNVPPSAAKAAFEFYMEQYRGGQEYRAERIREALIQNAAELRAEWKGDFKRNQTIGYEFLEKHLGESARVLGEKLMADGLPLGKDPIFNRLLANAGRATAGEEALYGGDGGGGGKSMNDEYKELINKPKLTADEHTRAMQLAEAMAKRDGRSRAA